MVATPASERTAEANNFIGKIEPAILLPITADTQDTALTIFSTLNDRGLPLSDADIFKAKIYNQLEPDEKKAFIERWKDSVRRKKNIQLLKFLLQRHWELPMSLTGIWIP